MRNMEKRPLACRHGVVSMRQMPVLECIFGIFLNFEALVWPDIVHVVWRTVALKNASRKYPFLCGMNENSIGSSFARLGQAKVPV